MMGDGFDMDEYNLEALAEAALDIEDHTDDGWVRLCCIYAEDGVSKVLAAGSVDGIGVLATWRRRADGTWEVRACDTEQAIEVEDFHEGEPVPPNPPAYLLEMPGFAAARTAVPALVAEVRRLASRLAFLDGISDDEDSGWCDCHPRRVEASTAGMIGRDTTDGADICLACEVERLEAEVRRLRAACGRTITDKEGGQP